MQHYELAEILESFNPSFKSRFKRSSKLLYIILAIIVFGLITNNIAFFGPGISIIPIYLLTLIKRNKDKKITEFVKENYSNNPKECIKMINEKITKLQEKHVHDLMNINPLSHKDRIKRDSMIEVYERDVNLYKKLLEFVKKYDVKRYNVLG